MASCVSYSCPSSFCRTSAPPDEGILVVTRDVLDRLKRFRLRPGQGRGGIVAGQQVPRSTEPPWLCCSNSRCDPDHSDSATDLGIIAATGHATVPCCGAEYNGRREAKLCREKRALNC